MCGRYATTRTGAELEDDFAATMGKFFTERPPDHNMAPTKPAPVIIARPVGDDGGFVREVATGTWGLIPSWAKDPAIASRLINARSETAASKPSFRSAFAKRRAIVPVDGYYEWYQPPADAEGKKAKQPFYLSNEGGLALAGLHEFRRESDGSWRLTFTILTTSAVGAEGMIHDRAPLLVPMADEEEWLAPEPWPEAMEHLIPATPGVLDTWPVSTAVNAVRNNGPHLIDPIALS